MRNPIPEEVRRWLYLLASGASVVAASGLLPAPYDQGVLVVVAVLFVLAAANVGPAGANVVEYTPDGETVVAGKANELPTGTVIRELGEEAYEPRRAIVEE